MKRMLTTVLCTAGLPARLLLLGLIRAYRVTLGPVVGGRCRFHPSCSGYAEEAVRTHGALKGAVLAAWRVLRCSPLSAGGLDPVPGRGAWRATGPQPPQYDSILQEID